ncbi:hypothetical protein ACQ4PT_071331 [Festuca glaucescens]
MERGDPFSKLSDDLLVEIFSRVPFKSTRFCNCVCRRWRDAVSHPDHRKKLPRSTLAGFFYKTGNLCCRAMNRHYKSVTGNWCPGIDPSLSFLPKYKLGEIRIDMLDCCNGLLLCRRRDTDYETTDYVVCNPATKRWVSVPGTVVSREVLVARLGFDPVVSSHFHVFEFAPAPEHVSMRLCVHARTKPLGIYSSKAGVWTHPSNWKCPIKIDRYSSSTFFRGLLYLSSRVDKVVAVDMEGNCRVINIPSTSHGSCIARDVYVSRGQLQFAISSASELSIWALEDPSSTENWTLKHNVSRLKLFADENSSNYHVIVHPEYKVILVVRTRFHSTYRSWTELMSYNMDSRELRSVSDLGHDCMQEALSPICSFVLTFIGRWIIEILFV